MKTFFLIIVAIMSLGSLKAQTEDGSVTEDIMTGMISFEALDNPRYPWFREGVSSYTPDVSKAEELTRRLPEFDLVIFMGTWCEDSQRLIPQLYKILMDTGYPMEQVQLYGLDRSKQSEDGLHETHLIEWVPTVIVKQFGSEVGRITESVQESMEADLLKICRQ